MLLSLKICERNKLATLFISLVLSSTTLAFMSSPNPTKSKRNLSSLKMASEHTPPKKIVVIGGGIQGASVAYHLVNSLHFPSDGKVTLLESQKLASAASGKGGGFMARSWGDGSVTQILHEMAFDMYEELSSALPLTTYRKLPVLSVSPGKGGLTRPSADVAKSLPKWLDGNVGPIRMMGYGDDTAQVTPQEVVEKFVASSGDKLTVCIGTATGIEMNNDNQVTGVRYSTSSDGSGEQVLECDAVVVSAGPWSCIAEDWFNGVVSLPMEGVKSTSIVWSPPESNEVVDATALFCGEDHRFGTHCKSL